MGTAGSMVIRPSGAIGVLASGAVAVKDAQGECVSCCGGSGGGGDWPIDPPPERDGVYLVATPCPGVNALMERVLVWVPRGTPQPSFTCTTTTANGVCYWVGNSSAVVLDLQPGDIVVGADLGAANGKSCCECRYECESSTIEVYEGSGYCGPHDRVYKKCCCGSVRTYSVTTAYSVTEPVFLSDGAGGGRWDRNVTTTTTHYGWTFDESDPFNTTITGSGTVTTHSELWSGGPPNWSQEVSDTTTAVDFPRYSACAPWGMADGLECSISASIPSGFSACEPTIVTARHDCREHTGAVTSVCRWDGTPFQVDPPSNIIFTSTYTFTSTLEASDNGCSGGCQGGSRQGSPRTPAQRLRDRL